MKRNSIKPLFLVLSLILVSILSACGSAKSSSNYLAETAAVEMPMAKAAPAEMEMAYEESGYGNAPTAEPVEASEIQDPNRKLIKTVSLELETKEIDNLFEALTSKVIGFGGYVESSNINRPSSNSYYYRSANIVARVPSSQLDAFISSAEGAGNVTYKSENVTDITLNYTDVESHKKSLMIESDRLNELLKKADTVADIIEIESRLSDVRYQLENYESQLRLYDNQIEYSTVYINISEVRDYTAPSPETIGDRIKNGFNNTLISLKNFGEDLLVTIIVLSPVILIVALLAVFVVCIIRAIKKKKSKKINDIKPTEEEDKKEA